MYQVVIVEDDPMVAMLNRRYTEKDPRFQVCRECPDGRAALEYLRSHPADLVILDMYMPQMDGMDVLRQLRAAGVSTDVIMITAASDTATVEAAMRLGVVDYLVKPFEYDRFCQALDAFDRRRQAIRAQSVNQQQLDELLHRGPAAAAPAEEKPEDKPLPKGLQPKTLEAICACLQANPQGLTCEQLAMKTGFSAVTARHYVHYLVECGRADSRVDYSTGGRPSVIYTLHG